MGKFVTNFHTNKYRGGGENDTSTSSPSKIKTVNNARLCDALFPWHTYSPCSAPSSIQKSHEQQEIEKDSDHRLNFPNDDVEEEITDRSLFNSSGYGLFANRNFKAKEWLGVYLGKVSHTQSNSGYCFDWAYNGDDYFVDAVGGIGHPVYFGMHLINHSRLHVNVTVTEDLYFSASRDICKGEELYMSYGSEFWTSVETHAQQKKEKEKLNFKMYVLIQMHLMLLRNKVTVDFVS